MTTQLTSRQTSKHQTQYEQILPNHEQLPFAVEVVTGTDDEKSRLSSEVPGCTSNLSGSYEAINAAMPADGIEVPHWSKGCVSCKIGLLRGNL